MYMYIYVSEPSPMNCLRACALLELYLGNKQSLQATNGNTGLMSLGFTQYWDIDIGIPTPSHSWLMDG